MKSDELKGLVLFACMVGIWATVLLGCMARRIDKIQRLIDEQIEENEKYIN